MLRASLAYAHHIRVVLIVLVIVLEPPLTTAARGHAFTSRIVGGSIATSPVQLPYIVSLSMFGSHLCGGSIINERTVLTAAHCLVYVTPRLLQVHAGALSHDFRTGVMLPVRSIYRHVEWTPDTMDYDIGVVRLLWSVRFGANIQPIRLPKTTASDDLTQPPVGSMAIVSGWGLTSNDGPESTELRYARVPIMAQQRCTELMPDAITPRMMCAGYAEGGIDACQQDSGGPLEFNGQLVGIVSWGIGCALPDKPGVYTRVAALMPWLRQVMRDFYGETL